MTIKLRTLYLALITTFAISTVAVPAAQAESPADFWAATDAVKIDSVADGHQSFVSATAPWTCSGLTRHASYTAESSELTMTDVGYQNCSVTKAGVTFPVTIKPEVGCHFTYTAGTYTNTGAGLSHGSVHICGMAIEVFNLGSHTTKRCEIHVPAQTLTGVTYKNTTTEGKMAVTVELNEVSTTQTVTDFNTLGCDSHLHETAVFTGNFWLTATNAGQKPVDITVQTEKPAEFWAETGTVEIDSIPDSAHHVFVAGGKTTTCTTGVTNHAAYSGVSASQTATNVAYTGCHMTTLGLSFPTTVVQEAGCHYTFTAGAYTTAADLSHGSVHICGSTIDVYTNHHNHTTGIARCQLHVPAQTINGVTYKNGIGPNGKMAVTVEFNNVGSGNVTITDVGILGCKNHETVTTSYTGSIWAQGTDSLEAATDTTLTGT